MAISTILTRWPLLRLTGLVLAIPTIIMLASIIPLTDQDGFVDDGMNKAFTCFPFAGNCWTVLYNGSMLLVLVVRGSYHPGIDIAMDFLGWGLQWAMGILLVIWRSMSSDVEWTCDYRGADSQACANSKKMSGIQWAGGILSIVIGYEDPSLCRT